MAAQEKKQKDERKEFIGNGIASSTAAATAVAIFNPLDCLRVRWQVTRVHEAGLVNFGLQIARTEGVYKGLWRPGLFVNAVGTGMSSGIRMALYPVFRDWLTVALGDTEKGVHTMMIAGFIAGAVGYGLATPAYQIKTRLQAESGIVKDGVLTTGFRKGFPPEYRSGIHALTRIAREEGLFQLYRGWMALVVRGALLTAGQQLGYDWTKTFVKRNDFMVDGPMLHLLGSVAAGFFATSFSAPADILMTRYQTAKLAGRQYTSLLDCAKTLIRENGVLALYRGWTPFFLRVAPLYTVMMPLYEQLRRLMGLGYFN